MFTFTVVMDVMDPMHEKDAALLIERVLGSCDDIAHVEIAHPTYVNRRSKKTIKHGQFDYGSRVQNLRGDRFGAVVTQDGVIVVVLWDNGEKTSHLSAELKVSQ